MERVQTFRRCSSAVALREIWSSALGVIGGQMHDVQFRWAHAAASGVDLDSDQ